MNHITRESDGDQAQTAALGSYSYTPPPARENSAMDHFDRESDGGLHYVWVLWKCGVLGAGRGTGIVSLVGDHGGAMPPASFTR